MNRRLAAVLVGAVALGTLAVTTPAEASVASMGPGINLRAGAHHSISPTLHAGYWTLNGHRMVCISYNAQGPDGSVQALTSPLPTPSAEADRRIKTTVNAYGNSADAHIAARIWFALAHDLVDDPAAKSAAAANLRADLPGYEAQLSTQDRAGFRAMLAASAIHGPYRATGTVTKTVAGQSGSATVTVLGSNGKPAAGLAVSGVTVVGGTVTAAPKVTDANGQAIVRYAATANAQTVTLKQITGPSSTTVYANRPSSGRQVVVGAGFTESTSWTGCATVCPVSADVHIHAQCDDKGNHQVDITFTAEDLPGIYRGTVNIGGHISQVEVAAGETRTVSGQITTGQDLTVGYQILDAAGTALVTSTLYQR